MLPLTWCGRQFQIDPDGGLFWPDQSLLAIADIHLEKGSAFARRGMPIPPYDSAMTLERLEAMIRRVRPKIILSMGDAFHDRRGPESLSEPDRERLERILSFGRWIWLTGNHDPQPWTALGGHVQDELVIEDVRFGHDWSDIAEHNHQVIGHLHPKARFRARSLGVSRPCFALGSKVMIMPAFGAYAGGLNVLDPAITNLMNGPFEAILLGDKKLFRLPSSRLTPDPPRHRFEEG